METTVCAEMVLPPPSGGGGVVLPVDLPLNRQPARVYLMSLKDGHGRRMMERNLHTIAATLTGGACDAWTMPWHVLTHAETQALASQMGNSGLAAQTVRQRLAALRGALKEAWLLGQMEADQYQRARSFQLPKAAPGLLRGRALDVEEIAAMLDKLADDARPVARRDAALLLLLFTCGLRRTEAVFLDLCDYRAGDLGHSVFVWNAKGGKSRSVPVADMVVPFMAAWLEVRGDEPGPLFLPQAPWDAAVFEDRRLSDSSLLVITRRLAAQAGIADFSPHDLRRSAATHMIEARQNLAAVAGVLGHTRLEMTLRYDRSGDAARRRAVNSVRLKRLPPRKKAA